MGESLKKIKFLKEFGYFLKSSPLQDGKLKLTILQREKSLWFCLPRWQAERPSQGHAIAVTIALSSSLPTNIFEEPLLYVV